MADARARDPRAGTSDDRRRGDGAPGAGALKPARVLLVGGRGFGRWHLANVLRHERAGLVRLVGVCDRAPDELELAELAAKLPVGPDLAELLRATAPDITIVSTPIHTHVDFALTAARTGCHVLVEKPPATSLDELARLEHGLAEAGVSCQVGFQSLGSLALPALREIIDAGMLGDVEGVGAAGAWTRDVAYYSRSPWAGRRRLDGVDVVDGALTNPFAHAVATALHVAGARDLADVADVDVELYRANPIEADDTSCARIVTADGVPVTVAATLCADQEGTDEPPPYVVVHGTEGTARLSYVEDTLEVRAGGRRTVTQHGRQDLLADLVAHIREPARPLRVPVAATRAFTRVFDAVRTAPDPMTLPPDAIEVVGEGPQQRRMVRGIRHAVARSAEELLMFSELALPWAAVGRR